MEHFVDRDAELDRLTDCYESETGDFSVAESFHGTQPEHRVDY